MFKSWFKKGEQDSPTSPTLALLDLLANGPEVPDAEWEQMRGRFVEACTYIYLDRGTIHSTYHSAAKSINEFIARYMPSWSLSSDYPEVETAFVWAIAKIVSSNAVAASVASILLDKFVNNGAFVAALRTKLNPTGLRKVLNLGAARFSEMEVAMTSRQCFDSADAFDFLNSQFMQLRQVSYLSWHSSAPKELADKFPNVVAYRALRGK
jgi:hypothetical protein